MEGQTCPYCKSTTFRNPLIKILINVCGHILCESCVNVIFCRGSGQCPECKAPLRRIDYRVQQFEDVSMEKELQVRKNVLKYYNKKEEDFTTLVEYNDYLEEIEVIVYNLTHKVDVVNTNRRIDEYKRLNSESIQRNRTRLGRDEKEVYEILATEKEQQDARRQELEQIENELKKKRQIFKSALLDELEFSTKDASAVINDFVEKANKLREEERIITAPKPVLPSWKNPIYRSTAGKIYSRVAKMDDGPLYVYEEPKQMLLGPRAPTLNEIKSHGYLRYIVKPKKDSVPAGYCTSLGCQRAMQEAFAGLFYSSSI